MKRGSIAILLILSVGVAAAGFTVWYHYRNQYRAQKFWGGSTARLIDKAPQIEVLQLGPVGSTGLSAAVEAAEEDAAKALETRPEGEAEKPEAEPAVATKAVEFDDRAWAIMASKPALGAKGVTNLRRALVLDTTYDWDVPAPDAAEPTWRYALVVDDGKNSATVLFDFESRQVALAGGRRTAQLNQMANDDIHSFFQEQFVEAAEKPANDKPTAANPAEEKPAEEKPAAEPPAPD